MTVPIDRISANPLQPRQQFDAESLDELADSIRIHGVLQPLLLRERPDDHGYYLIAGERRLRASKLAGLKDVPAMILDADETQTLAIAITENIQRSDLNPIEEARGYAILRDQFELTQEEIARRVGKPRSSVANLLRLLSLPQEVQDALLAKEISMGHARALAGLPHEEACIDALDLVIRNKMNVRDTESLCQDFMNPAPKRDPESIDTGTQPRDPNILALEEALRDHLGTPVRVQPRGATGGRITIQFFDLDQLDHVLSQMGMNLDL